MHARYVVLAVLAAAVTLTSVAAAGPSAAKQRFSITMRSFPGGTFVFTPMRAGVLKRDSCTTSHGVLNFTPRVVIRDGQSVSI